MSESSGWSLSGRSKSPSNDSPKPSRKKERSGGSKIRIHSDSPSLQPESPKPSSPGSEHSSPPMSPMLTDLLTSLTASVPSPRDAEVALQQPRADAIPDDKSSKDAILKSNPASPKSAGRADSRGTPRVDRKDPTERLRGGSMAKMVEEKEKKLTTQLSEQQVAELKEAFSIFDKNGDGCISPDELRIFMETLGQKPTEKMVEALMREIDSDQDGEIDFDEFLQMMVSLLNPKDKEEEVSKIFSIFDPKGLGYIKEKDLIAAFTTIGDEAMPLKDVEEIIKAASRTVEGHIEFKSLMRLLVS